MPENSAVVLVVDDNEMNRDMLGRRLQRQNCDVVMAEDGTIALDIVKKHPFDLILLDIMMPNLSGYDVLERLKADPDTEAIPVIMISAVDDLDSVVKCIEMGAEDYLFKPFNPVLLKARVGACLDKRRTTLAGTQTLLEIKQSIETMQVAVDGLASSELSGEQQPHLDKIQTLLANIAQLLK